MLQRPPAGTIPEGPGSYQFKDAAGRVIYVGKARSLRQRLSNYFQNPAQLHPRTAQMVATAASVEWIQVRNEVEALMLEFSLIKEHRPRFNVRLVDDKSYPYLAVTVADEWPRPMVMRGAKRKGVRYFGPYAHAYAIRETLDLLLRTFPLRTCTDAKFGRHHRMGRPCLLFHIEKCSGPCVGEVDGDTYGDYVEDLLEFLAGDTDAVVARLDRQMREAADELEYERAARVRDRLASVRKAIEKQQIVGDRSEDVDVIGLAEDDLEAAVQVFFVRKGRVVGRRGFVLDKVEALDRPQLIGNILEGLYYDEPATGYPKVVLTCDLPDDPDLYETWLTEQRANASFADGRHLTGRVQIRVPQRGDKRELLGTVTRNAEEEFVRHRLKRASDINARSKALEELQDALGLPVAPLRIECYDNSHLSGTDYVSSMVVFEDGLPAKNQYRRFRLRDVPGNDDFAAMEEVLTRRLRNYLEDREKPVAERGRFQYPPQLLMVDGGKGQLSVAIRVLDELGLAEEIPVCALAKEFEEVFLPGQSDSIRLPRQSEALYLLQRLRDESHRFAITYQRQLRNKRMTKGFLDEIPGLGPTRRKRLIRELGGVNNVRRASLDQLESLSWLPLTVARAIVAKNHAAASSGRTGTAAGRGTPAGLSPADLEDEDWAGDEDPVANGGDPDGHADDRTGGTPRRRTRRGAGMTDPAAVPLAVGSAELDAELWERNATWWQDGFTEGADPEYEEQILPLAAQHLAGCRRVLDVGCGEGQISRLAARGGADLVVGLDPTWSQVRVAVDRAAGPHYLRAGATGLPLADEAFDAVVACLVFEHIVDVDGALAEVARVLQPGGRFLFFLNHPLLQTPGSGWIDDHVLDPPEQYWRIGPYLVEDHSLEEVEKDVFIPFVHRPLSRYVNALAANGLLLTHMDEPPPPPGFLARATEYEAAASVPRLLLLRTEKLLPQSERPLGPEEP